MEFQISRDPANGNSISIRAGISAPFSNDLEWRTVNQLPHQLQLAQYYTKQLTAMLWWISSHTESLIGRQMYAMLCTRTDIAYAVSQISQHSSAPTVTHQSTGKRGFRYLNATSTMGITYDGSNGLELEAYCDADYAASEGRKSTMAVFLKLTGAAVSWMSKLEPTVAISSTESEYMALLQAVKESIWIQRLLKE